MKEYILCAAIWFDDGERHVHQPKNIETGFVVCGRRHHNCFAIVGTLAPNQKIHLLEKEQGFLTNTDRFVDRIEGLSIAIAAGQTLPYSYGKELYSEDLY